eukprot:17531_1
MVTNSLSVYPLKFSIRYNPKSEACQRLTLTNNSKKTIAWKLKTNKLKRYGMCPTRGFIQSGEDGTCDIYLVERFSGKSGSFSESKLSDKFLVESIEISAKHSGGDFAKIWNQQVTQLKKKSANTWRRQIRCDILLEPQEDGEKSFRDRAKSSIVIPPLERTNKMETFGNGIDKKKVRFVTVNTREKIGEQKDKLVDEVGRVSASLASSRSTLAQCHSENVKLRARLRAVSDELFGLRAEQILSVNSLATAPKLSPKSRSSPRFVNTNPGWSSDIILMIFVFFVGYFLSGCI